MKENICCWYSKESSQWEGSFEHPGKVLKILIGDFFQRGSYKGWEINMGVYPRLEYDSFTLIYCLWHFFYIYSAFEFYAIPLLIYDVMFDITTTP